MVKVEDDSFTDCGIAEGDIVVIDTATEPAHGDVVLAVEGAPGEEQPVITSYEPEKAGCPEPAEVLGVAVRLLTVNDLRRNNDDS